MEVFSTENKYIYKVKRQNLWEDNFSQRNYKKELLTGHLLDPKYEHEGERILMAFLSLEGIKLDLAILSREGLTNDPGYLPPNSFFEVTRFYYDEQKKEYVVCFGYMDGLTYELGQASFNTENKKYMYYFYVKSFSSPLDSACGENFEMVMCVFLGDLSMITAADQ